MKDTADNPHNATFYTIYDSYSGDDAFDGTEQECLQWKVDMAKLYPAASRNGRWTNPIRNHVQPKES
tara:strand:- start:67 stop:267 length:201 start_codon:yes stop_codon:yes gene_type:complete